MAEHKTSHGFRNLLILFTLIVIVSTILFLVYQSKVKPNEQIPTAPVISNETIAGISEAEAIQRAKEQLLKENNLIGTEEDNNRIWWIVGITILLFIIMIVIYYYYFRNKEEQQNLKQPVPIEKIKEIFKEKLAKDYGLGWFQEGTKFRLKNEREFVFRNQRIWYHRATGDKFLLIEFIVNNGPMYGFHIALIPADKGDQILMQGEWTIIHQTDMNDFKLLSTKYPATSIVDKTERQRLYIAEQIAGGELPKDSIDSLVQPSGQQLQQPASNRASSKPYFSSPFSSGDDGGEGEEGEEGEEGLSNVSSTQYPRKNYSYRRRRR